MTPFTTSLANVPQRDSVNEAVERTFVAREVAIDVLKFHLERAQNKMKSFTDKGRTDGKFKIGMWVYLKLQPHRQVSIRKGQQHKLSPKYYGPFKICAKVGNVAYKLELPNRKVAKEGNRVVVYLLVQWSNDDKDDATWEPYDSFIQRPATAYTLTASNVSECNKVVLMGNELNPELVQRNVLTERNRQETFCIMAELASASFDSAIMADFCNLIVGFSSWALLLCSGTETEEGLWKELQFSLVDNSKLNVVYFLNRS
ncbi:retrotransposable element Tf2 [Tanacetum coccineum]